MKKSIVWMLLLLGAGLLAACSGPAASPVLEESAGEEVVVDGGSYTNISPAELDAMLGSEDVTLINVHIPHGGDIPATDSFVPFNAVQQNLEHFPVDKDAKVVLYCRSGNMSRTASETLLDLGYSNVWNLEGGYIAWQEAGYPMTGTE